MLIEPPAYIASFLQRREPVNSYFIRIYPTGLLYLTDIRTFLVFHYITSDVVIDIELSLCKVIMFHILALFSWLSVLFIIISLLSYAI